MSTKEQNEIVTAKKNLFNFRPVLFCAIFLSLGICFYFQVYFNGVSVSWLAVLPLIAVTPFFFCRKGKSLYYTVLSILLLITSFFVGYFSFAKQIEKFTQGGKEGEACVIGKVVEKREYSYSTGLVLSDISIDGEKTFGKLVAYLPASFSENIDLCDEILLHGTIKQSELNSEEFSLQAGDFGDGIRYCANAHTASVVGYRFDLFLFLRSRTEKVIESGMDADTAAVMRAMLFGKKDGIEASLYENIRYGGIAHIFAVSGLHIGALFSFCLLLTQKTPLRRSAKVIRWGFIAFILFVYTGICGFSPSVVRASVMCLVGYLASLLKIKKDRLEVLAIAALLILLFSPSALFEVGFQLSFAACFGIIFLAKLIGQVFDECKKCVFGERKKEALFQAEDTQPLGVIARIWRMVTGFLSVSLAAQIATAPLQLFYFGYVSGWALLLNCLFVPLMGVFFPFALGITAVACLLPVAFAPILFYLPNLIWSAGLLLFYAVDFSAFSLSCGIGIGAILFYCFGCLFLSDKWNISKFSKVLCILVCFCSCAVLTFL